MTEICTIVAIFTPKPEHQTEVKELLLTVTPRVHQEAGCEFYTLNEDVEGRLIHIEAWSSRDLWQAHMLQPTVRQILSGVEGKLVRDIEVYEMYNLPTGSSGKGALAQAIV
ncbi:MAG: putative quinol monooxygenase [Micrococcales bacterium]